MANATSNTLPLGHKDPTRRAVLAGLPLSFAPLAHMLPNIYANLTAAEPPIHPVLALPFVRDSSEEDRVSGANPRSFWVVDPTGHYGTDCSTGSHYAALALDYMVANRSPHLLTWIVSDMMAPPRRRSGVEVGFVSVIGRLATNAHASRMALRDGGLA